MAERLPDINAARARASQTKSAPPTEAVNADERPIIHAEHNMKANPSVPEAQAAAKNIAAKAKVPKAAARKTAAPKAADTKAAVPKKAVPKKAVSKAARATSPSPKTSAKPKDITKPIPAEKVKAVVKAEAEAKTIAPMPASEPALKPGNKKAGKVVRDSFSMPKREHAEIKRLRAALAKAGRPATKSEVLRAAFKLLGERSIKEVLSALDTLPVVLKGKGKKQG